MRKPEGDMIMGILTLISVAINFKLVDFIAKTAERVEFHTLI